MTEGRDANGRFVKGHKLAVGGGRPSKAERAELRATIDAHVSAEAEAKAWGRVQEALLHGGRGWLDLFKLFLEYRYGKPSMFVDVTSVGQPIKGYVGVSPDDWDKLEA